MLRGQKAAAEVAAVAAAVLMSGGAWRAPDDACTSYRSPTRAPQEQWGDEREMREESRLFMRDRGGRDPG